jgi:hypothetical protein
MDYRLRVTTNTGPLSLDASDEVPKSDRLRFVAGAAVCTGEKDEGSGALQARRLAIPDNTLFWRHAGSGPRGAWGAYSWAVPAVIESVLNGDIRPLAGWAQADGDFEKMRDARRPVAAEPVDGGYQSGQEYRFVTDGYGREDARLPVGTRAIVVQTTGHGVDEPLAFPAGGPLVAARDDRTLSRHVFDGSGGGLGNHGPMHAMVRVTEVPADPNASVVGEVTTHVPALQLSGSEAESGVGYGSFYSRVQSPGGQFAPLGGYLGHERGGIVHPGGVDDRHQVGISPGGLQWNPAHFNPAAAWFADDERDGPFAFSPFMFQARAGGLNWPNNTNDAEWVQTFLSWDTDDKRWVWMTPSLWTEAIGPLPEPTGMQQRLTQVVNNNVNVNININFAPVFIQNIILPPPLAPLNPGQGDKIDPMRCPREIAVPSIYGTPVRESGRQPYDGRFGWKPINPETGEGTLDPAEFIGVPAGPVDEQGLPISLNGEGPPPGETPTQSDPESGGGIPIDPLTETPAAGAISGLITDSLEEQRNLEATDADHLQKPLCYHIQGFGASNLDGTWAETTAPGDMYVRGGTVPGGALFGPAEVLLDAVAPELVSDSAFVVYNGLFGGSALGNPSKIGSATPSQRDGSLSDGWYDQATGATGVVDRETVFVDASGADQKRRHTLKGRLARPWHDHTGTTLSGTINAWNPVSGETPGAIIIDVTFTGATINGIAGGADGDELVIWNDPASGGAATLNHLSGSAAAGDRLYNGSGAAAVTLSPGDLVRYKYEATVADSANGAWVKE